jgi:hypothetical protein
MKKEMYMRIDQSGEEGGVAEVKGAGANGMLNGFADLRNMLAGDQDFAGGEQLPGFNDEESSGV